MRSLYAELDHPAVDAFLDAVDAVMNGNTFLLKFRADAPVDRDNRVATLTEFLRDGLLDETIREADRDRDWWNLHDTWWPPDEPPPPGADALPSVVCDEFALVLTPLDATAMAARLLWMLTGSCSPYRRHLATEPARALVDGFLRYVLEPADGPAPRWEFCAVRPDFLWTVEPEGRESCRSYFDGCEDADTATFFYRDTVCYLLLTNGCP